MSYFNTYPTTPDMGLRESINAMLDHIAAGDSYGYSADCVMASNYRSILRDYGDSTFNGVTSKGIIVEHYQGYSYSLRLAPTITDSEGLAAFVEILVALCNDYPLYDEGDHSNLEAERLEAHIDDRRDDSDPDTASIIRAIWELDVEVHQEGGTAYISDEKFAAARDWAAEHYPVKTDA